MNNIGKTAAAGVALAALLGTGWWVIDQGQITPDALPGARETPAALLPPADTLRAEYKALSPEWVGEIDASIRLLTESLSMSGNIAASIALLDVLDARVARHEAKTLLAPLRAALASDREKLNAARVLDIAGVAATLDRMAIDIDTLPLLAARKPLLNRSSASPGTVGSDAGGTAPAPQSALPAWQGLWDALVARVSEVVQVRRVDNPQALLLTPEQSALVAERLRLRLLSARLALVSRQESVFLHDIGTAEKLLLQIFDPQDARVIEHQKSLTQFSQLSGRLSVPAGLKAPVAMEQLRQQLAVKPSSEAPLRAPVVPVPTAPSAPSAPSGV